jgi:hypothetical protein
MKRNFDARAHGGHRLLVGCCQACLRQCRRHEAKLAKSALDHDRTPAHHRYPCPWAAVLGLLAFGFVHRNRPRVGGKLGPILTTKPPPVLPSGFSRIYTRAVTLFVAPDASRFPTLKAFLRDGTAQQPVVIRIYRVAGCKAEIEIPDQAADYERIDAAQALALLRELPDPRLVRRLI